MNSGNYNQFIIFKKLNKKEELEEVYSCFAAVNKASGKTYMENGAVQSSSTLIFEIRYNEKLKNIQFDNEEYRIIYHNQIFSVDNVDNPNFENKKIKIVGDIVHGK